MIGTWWIRNRCRLSGPRLKRLLSPFNSMTPGRPDKTSLGNVTPAVEILDAVYEHSQRNIPAMAVSSARTPLGTRKSADDGVHLPERGVPSLVASAESGYRDARPIDAGPNIRTASYSVGRQAHQTTGV